MHPQKENHSCLIFAPPPEELEVQPWILSISAPDFSEATRLSEKLSKDLFDEKQIVLDFSNIPILTQSYLHALLYQPLRLAWALQVPIYVINEAPVIRSTLRFVENYALGG